MKRIESNEYFAAVKEYFVGHQVPARVYKFLLDMLREDEYKLSDDLIYIASMRLKRQKTAFASVPALSVFSCCVQSQENENRELILYYV